MRRQARSRAEGYGEGRRSVANGEIRKLKGSVQRHGRAELRIGRKRARCAGNGLRRRTLQRQDAIRQGDGSGRHHVAAEFQGAGSCGCQASRHRHETGHLQNYGAWIQRSTVFNDQRRHRHRNGQRRIIRATWRNDDRIDCRWRAIRIPVRPHRPGRRRRTRPRQRCRRLGFLKDDVWRISTEVLAVQHVEGRRRFAVADGDGCHLRLADIQAP